MSDLLRLLWRFEAHVVSSDIMRTAYFDVISQLVQLKSDRSARFSISAVPHVMTLDRNLDHAIDEARRYLVACDFRQCLREIEVATKTNVSINQAAMAALEIDTAKNFHGQLTLLLGSGPASSTTSPVFIQRLMTIADQLFQAGEFRQCKFVASLVKRQIQRLMAVSNVDEEINSVLLEETRTVQIVLQKCVLIDRGAAVRHLEPLVSFILETAKAQRYVLADEILNDLRAITADQARFIAEVERQFEEVTPTSATTISLALVGRRIAPSCPDGMAFQILLDQSLAALTEQTKSILAAAGKSAQVNTPATRAAVA